MQLFDSFPRLESDRLILREWTKADLPALDELRKSEAVYRYLPTFLYEQSYENAEEMLLHMREECFDTKASILLAIELKESQAVAGIAEIYNYEPEKEKASVGYRLIQRFWGKGIATDATTLLTKYLLEQTDVRKITAHVMTGNAASAHTLEKLGFILRWSGLKEDWGFNEPVHVNKYMLKLSPEEKQALLARSAAQ